MAKNLNVSLAFTANTNEAIAAIKRLQKELNGLATGSALKDSGISQITPEIQRAMVAAGELQAKLEAATNLKTGKLDLGQFSDSLKKGGVSLKQYANQLNALGPAGRQAFTNLAQSIIQAEAPLFRCSQRIRELGTTLANTARWQLSSSILHGFMGAVSSAYGYAQDLNESLNDIRIVTGASVAEMDAFAAKANKAARALSTTTNEYAKASLIYFQQGDTQAQAMEKAAITTKMANVTGQSAETVSNQLTAIWNNFNKEGDVAYEHYADVLTKLGAATASSTDEIANGLEKFAGIADTIGLSYEYAASALATITATSRESEEVVGTALKTIFARIQGLKQGDTLEDGTTLNKYSEALQKVGISIFDQTGELKNMDNILEEMAAKWVTLSKDQQLALAQTVAGVRQYNQMVTLMDNWDFMEENLKTAGNADGELNTQAETYAESWKAARDEVRAAAEELYTKLLDDDFFIGFLKGIEKVIDGVSGLIDAFGGLGGVLTTIGAYVTRIFQKEMAQGLRTAAQNIRGFINPKGVQAEQDAKKEEAIDALKRMKSSVTGTNENAAENAALQREANMQAKLYAAAKNLTEEEAKALQIQMDSVRAMDKRAIAAGKAADAAKEEVEEARDLLRAYEQIEARDKAKKEFEEKHSGAKQSKVTEARRHSIENLVDYGANQRQTKQHEFGEYGDYINKNYGDARQRVADSGQEVTKENIHAEFMSGLRNAANSGDEIAQAIFEKINAAGERAAEEFGQSMKTEMDAAMDAAGKAASEKTGKIGKVVDTGALAEARAVDLRKSASQLTTKTTDAGGKEVTKDAGELAKVQTALREKIAKTVAEANNLKTSLADIGESDAGLESTISTLNALGEELKQDGMSAERLDEILDQIKYDGTDSLTGDLEATARRHSVHQAGAAYGGETGEDDTTRGGQDYLRSRNAARKQVESENSKDNVDGLEKDLNDNFEKSGNKAQDWADGIANATSTIMALSSAITSVQGVIDVFNDPDATGWDKVSAIISVIVGVLPVATGLFQMFGTTAATSGAAAGAGMTAAMWPIGLIILAVTALIAVFVLLADAAHAASPAGQFEAASKAAEEAANAASQVRAEYEALNQSLNALDSGIEAIQEMERGTLEWRAAIADSNAALIELLSTYGMLSSENFTTDADGLMQITDEAKAELLERQQNAVREADNANYMAQVNKNNAQSRLKASEEVGAGISVMRVASDGNGGTYTYDAATENSHLSADIGQAIAAAMQSGALTDMSDKDSIAAALESVAGLTEAEAQSVADQIASNAELQASMFELGSAINANTEANRLLNNQIVENAFGDKIDGATQGMTDAQQEQVKNMMGADLEALTNELYESTYKDKGWLGGGITDEAIQKQYAEAMGWATDTIDNQSGNKAKYYAKDGTEIGVISDEVARRYMAQQAAIEQMGGNVQQYVDNLQNLIQSGNAISEGVGQAMGTFAGGMGGDISNLTAEERQKMGEAIGKYDETAGTFTFNGEEINNEKAQALGYADAKAYYDALQGALNAYDVKADKLLDSYSESVQNAMNNADFSKLGLDAQKKVGDALQNAYTTQGSEAMDNLSSVFENAGEDAGALADIIAGVDWTSDNAIYDLNSALTQQGIKVSELGPGWDAYVQCMLNAGDSVYKLIDALDELRGKMASINKITGDLEFGSVISDEDYETLLSYNKEIADMFTMTAEGWKFVGDVDQLNSMLETSVEDVGKFKEEFAAAQNAGDVITNYAKGWQMEDGSFKIGGDYMKTDQQKALAMNTFLNESAFGEGTFDPIIEASGYSKEALGDAISTVANATEADKTTEAYKNALAIVESFYGTAQGFMDDYAAGKFEETTAEELWVNNQIHSLDELDQAYQDGQISLETYQRMRDSVFKEEVEAEGFDYEEVQRYAEVLKNSTEAMVESEEEAGKLAIIHAKFDRGLSKLSSNMSKWNKILVKGADTLTSDYIEAMDGAKESLSDMLDVDISTLSDDFIIAANESGLLAKAAAGDKEALEKLQGEYRISIVTNLEDGVQEQVNGLLGDMQTQIDQTDLKVGMSMDEAGLTGIVDSFNEMLRAGEITVADLEGIFNSFSFSPDVTWEKVPIENANTQEAQYYYQDSMGNYVAWDGDSKTATEGYVYLPKINSDTSVYKPSGSSSSNDTGGGGGGDRKVEKKNLRNDGERYHYLTNQLEDLESEYDAISDAADRAFGADKLKLMDDQIEKTKELKQQNEDYIKALQKNHSVDQEVMKAQYANLLGDNALQFDIDNEKGEIRNFDDIQQSMIDDYNAKADLYEAGDMSEEDWQAYEKLYEQVEKDIEMYEQSEDDLRDALARRKELEYQEIDEKLAKIEYAAEVKLEISQDELDVIEYQLELLDDKAFSSADKIAQNVAKASNLVQQMETTQQAMNDILSVSNISDGDIATLLDPKTTEEQMAIILKDKNITEDQVNSIRNYRDSLLDMNKQLEEVRDTIQEEVTAAFEEYNEELDKGISQFEHYNSVLESYQNIVDIVGKDVLGISDDTLAEMSATQVENSINQLASVKEKVDSINKARDDAYAKMNDMTLTEADRERWAETYETMNEAAQEAQEELLSTWEGTLEAIVAQFDQAVQAAVDKFNQAFYESGLEGLSEDFSFAQEQDDMYLEDYQKIYELSKLTRDINKTMDDTKSIAGKQKLKSLMEDINKLQEEGVEMSEYDLEYLQAEYELRLAEIALEEAQRAKDTVRLSRDSEGNFSYVYTQNTDAVDEAQQKYEDALYSMQDLSSNYIDEMSAKLIETSQAMQEELAALRVEDYANIDEYYAAVAEVEAKYQDQLSAQEAELQKAIGNNKKLYDEDWANYAAVTGYKISATEDFVTSWGDTTLAQMMGLDDATSFTDVMAGAAESLVAGLLEAANTYYTNVDEANEAAGTSTGQFAEVLQENIDAIKTESADAAKAVEEMATKMDTAMQDIINKTAEWQREHGANIDKIIEDNLRAAESYNGLLEYLTNNAVGDYEVLVRPSSNSTGDGDPPEGEGFATGGYTGSWGASGKLAWLHEKELILNKNDTENMLKMIELTRAMISTIDAQASQLSQGMGMMSAATYKEDRHEILEQFVEIKADFPNVSNHTEIEEALGNLINTASQYAHRRK